MCAYLAGKQVRSSRLFRVMFMERLIKAVADVVFKQPRDRGGYRPAWLSLGRGAGAISSYGWPLLKPALVPTALPQAPLLTAPLKLTCLRPVHYIGHACVIALDIETRLQVLVTAVPVN